MKSKQEEMVEIKGRMVPRSRVGFLLREDVTTDGRKVLVGSGGAIYERSAGNALVRLDKKKVGKAAKKAAKRERRRQCAAAVSEYLRLEKLAAEKGWTRPVNDTFPPEAWLAYWRGMETSEGNPEAGRPVAPHRPGGGTLPPAGQ